MKKFFAENFYLLTAALLTCVFISNDAFLPAIPTMASNFGSTEARLQQGVAIFVLGSLILQIFVGPISDRFGRRPVMISGAMIFLAGSIGCIFVADIYSFLLARMFQGSAVATTQVSAMAAINEYYYKDKAIQALAVSSNINLIAPILGPIFGAAILSLPVPKLPFLPAQPWRYIFIYIAILGLWVTTMLILFMPEPAKSTVPRPRAPGLLYIFRQLPKILVKRAITLYSISFSMGGFAMLLWITGAPVMLIGKLGLSENQYAWMQMPIFACTVIGNSLSPFLVRNLGGRRHMNITHGIMLGTSPIIFLVAYLWQNSAVALVMAFSLFSLNLGLINAVKNQIVVSLSEYKGSVTSVLMLFGSGGVFLGSLTASFLGGLPNYVSFAVIALASFLLGFFGLLANLFWSSSH